MSIATAARHTDWIGCIDFGTALSKVAVVKAVARDELSQDCIRPLPVGIRQGFQPRSPFLCPSIVFIHSDRTVFGLEAEADARRGQIRGRQAFASLKQYLSTHSLDELDAPLPEDIDPTGRFTPRAALMLYLAHLLERAGTAATLTNAPWPVPIRIARPAWDVDRAAAGEEALKQIVISGFRLVDRFGARLSAARGISNDELIEAIDLVSRDVSPVSADVFKRDRQDKVTVLEATAVAAGAIKETGRRIVIVVDVGGGTTDFGAFMTGLPGRHVLAEIERGSNVLRRAGDYLDMLLSAFVLKKLGYDDPTDPAARGAVSDLRRRQREYKELLFRNGEVTIEVDDMPIVVEKPEFVDSARVTEFAAQLREKFSTTLDVACECARSFPRPRVPIELLFTGGGHGLPMVTDLKRDADAVWTTSVASPDFAERSNDPDFQAVRRQVAVAVGGAIRDLPAVTAPLRP
jgi:hypothetical protein